MSALPFSAYTVEIRNHRCFKYTINTLHQNGGLGESGTISMFVSTVQNFTAKTNCDLLIESRFHLCVCGAETENPVETKLETPVQIRRISLEIVETVWKRILEECRETGHCIKCHFPACSHTPTRAPTTTESLMGDAMRLTKHYKQIATEELLGILRKYPLGLTTSELVRAVRLDFAAATTSLTPASIRATVPTLSRHRR